MLVYDVSAPESFGNLTSWYEQIKACRAESAITGVVIASKTDLSDRPGAITEDQGRSFSMEKGLEFFEACATKGIVDAPFHFLAEVFYQKYTDRKTELENLATRYRQTKSDIASLLQRSEIDVQDMFTERAIVESHLTTLSSIIQEPIERFMNELEPWSMELQRHNAEDWNQFIGTFCQCLRGSDKKRSGPFGV